MSDRHHLRLVDRAPPAPRLAVRITCFTGHGGPHGRSRLFKLAERDLDALLRNAESLEARR